MMYPRYLFDLRMNATAKLLYMVLLDRARLSAGSDKWIDREGNVFIYYTISELSETLQKGKTVIEEGLKTLEKEELIRRKRQGPGKANLIYVRILAPVEGKGLEDHHSEISDKIGKPVSDKPGSAGPENHPQEGRYSELFMAGNPERNKNKESNNNLTRTMIKKKTPYGRYGNVYLDEDEAEMIRCQIPGWQKYIERLSTYMVSSGKTYQNHAATIIHWAERDGAVRRKRDYSYEEGESL